MSFSSLLWFNGCKLFLQSVSALIDISSDKALRIPFSTKQPKDEV